MAWLSSTRLHALAWFVGLACVSVAAARLPDEELEALSVVATTLGKRDWNIGLDENPCTNLPPWWNNNTIGNKVNESGIYCNCDTTQNTTITTCHVTRLVLKSFGLNGSLPRELVRLPFLEEIDLTRNYVSGPIPPQWGSMQSLKNISLTGNRLTGQIPKELANIITLEELLLNSNNLTGVLPRSLAQLTSLKDFRISSNNLTGSIPDYIGNWTNITRLEIQGSGLTGPIPSNLTSLIKLENLRISDLNGNPSNFPSLSVSTKWQKLILRSCNLVGEIPPFIGDMTIDEDLDLSFNNLTGPIPPKLAVNPKANIYLTGNSLSGTVPEFKTKNKVDLSYNNFTTEKSSDQYCGDNGPNLFANSKGSNRP